jgi:hypothetical protein
MKKTVYSIMVLFLVINTTKVSAITDLSIKNACDNIEKNTIKCSTEFPMEFHITKNETYEEEKSNWILSTILANEENYGQKVNEWLEDDNFITFYFSENKQITDNHSFEDSNETIYKIEYLKPTSDYANTTYPTKIIHYFEWSGFFSVDRKTASNYPSIANLLLQYTPKSSVLASWVISEAIGTLFHIINQSLPIEAETRRKYFYLNKAGSVYISGVWLPRVYVGSRRHFNLNYTYVRTLPYGEPLPFIKENNGNGMPPSNYDFIEVKNYFNDDLWILNQTQLRAFSYSYVDVFKQVFNVLP